MWKTLRKNAWMPIALAAVGLIWALAAAFAFCHTFIMAGGSNPFVIFEGRLPTWNGQAMAMGLASVASDMLKAVAGFVLVGAIFGPASYGWGKRTVAIVLALAICVPTFIWSAINAAGMASLAFGDTIAGRKIELRANASVVTSMEQMEGRLKWLEQQKTCSGSACRAHAREAAELRKELRGERKELRSGSHVGSAAPAANLIAGFASVSEDQAAKGIVIGFVLLIELISAFGIPAIALAAQVATPTRDFVTPSKVAAEPEVEIEIVAAKSDPEGGDQKKSEKSPGKLNGHKGNFELRADAPEQKSASLPFASGSEAEIEIGDEVGDDLRRPQRERRTKMGRPRKGALGDGHLDDWCDQVFGEGKKPTWRDYKLYCKSIHLAPMSRGEMWRGIKRYEGVGKKALGRFFEPDRREAIVTQH